MANRHKSRKNVGGATPYNAQGSNVLKEAKERASGGKACAMPSGGSKSRVRRASGGSVGADKHPFSSAHVKGG